MLLHTESYNTMTSEFELIIKKNGQNDCLK